MSLVCEGIPLILDLIAWIVGIDPISRAEVLLTKFIEDSIIFQILGCSCILYFQPTEEMAVLAMHTFSFVEPVILACRFTKQEVVARVEEESGGKWKST